MPAQSEAQRKFMGWVHACQTGQIDNCPPRVKKVAKTISKKAAKDFAVKESFDDKPITFKVFYEMFL